MAHVNSLKSVWEKADRSYIQATKSGGRTPVSRRLFPQAASEGSGPGGELHRAEVVSEDASESSSTAGDFAAIPKEFRPSRHGKDLMEIRASPKKGDSLEEICAEEPPKNERFSNRPNVPRRKRCNGNSNSFAIQNEVRDGREFFITEKSEQPQRDIDEISDDETGKQKKTSEMFFYSYSSQNASTSEATDGCQKNLSEKSKLKNVPEQKPYRKFYDSHSSRSKATNEIDMHASFEQPRKDTSLKKDGFFHGGNKYIPPKFQDRNAGDQNGDKDETNFSKYNKNVSSKFQDKSTKDQNRASFADKGAQKITREVTVEKSIKWKNDLCEFKKPKNKPNYFYEYTKTTKESVSYVPSHSEDDDDEITKKPCQNFKKGREFFNNFPLNDFGHYKQRPENQRDKAFYSTYKAQRNEAKHFSHVRPQKSGHKFEEEHKCFQCVSSNDPIIVKHEIKVIHMNRQGRNNRIFNNYPQTFQPPKKDRNGKLINTDTRERNSKIKNNDYRGRSSKIINTDPRERNGKITHADTREHCDAKTEENTMAKTAETFQITRKKVVRIPLKLTDSSLEHEYAHNNVSRKCDSEKAAALIKYGREISDMIAGSYVAISTFLDNYEQWKDFRRVTMLLFEEVEKNLSQSGHKNKRIIEVAELVGTGCKMAQYVPHVGVSVAAKVIAFLSDVVVRMFSSSNSAKSIEMDDFQLKLCLQRDMDATADIYMYGMQCDLQFQETCQIIEEFHRKIQARCFEETFETGFLKEISLLNPKHPAVFYKKLGRFYKVLNDRHQSEEAKAFCGAFEDWPDALTTVSRLHRRFKTENWDSSSVMKAWEEVYNLLQNDQSAVGDVVKKIQDCILVLMREQTVMERYVMDLQRQC